MPDDGDDAALTGPAHELGRQPGLADAGVAGQQDGRGPAGHGAVDRGQEAVQFLGPADQRCVVPTCHVNSRRC